MSYTIKLAELGIRHKKPGASGPWASTDPVLRDGTRPVDSDQFTAPGVSGELSVGKSMTISPLSGESFGAGPNAVFHVSSTGKTGGTYTALSDYDLARETVLDLSDQTWDASTVSPLGGPGLKINNPTERTQINFDYTDEFFLSALTMFDTDPGDFSASHKTFWLVDDADGGAGANDTYDMVFLSKVNTTTRWVNAGNTGGSLSETANNILLKDQWFRFAAWVQDRGQSEMGFYEEILSGSERTEKNKPDTADLLMLDRAANSTGVNRLIFMGHTNSNNDGHVVGRWVDNMYIATGANSRARVEIRDAEQYEDGREAYVCWPEAWSGSEITATVYGPADLSGYYIHIIDGDGNHMSGGVGREIT